MTCAVRPLDAAVWIDERPFGHGAGCDGVSSSDGARRRTSAATGTADGASTSPRRCTATPARCASAIQSRVAGNEASPVSPARVVRRMPPSARTSTTRAGGRAHRRHRDARLDAAHDGRIAAWTLVEPAAANRAPISPTRHRPSSAPPASARSSCRAGLVGTPSLECRDRLVVPGNSRSANPNQVSASTPPSRSTATLNSAGRGSSERAEQAGDRVGAARPSCRRRRARSGRSRPGRCRRGRRARPCRCRPRRRSATRRRDRRAAGWRTGSECRGAGRELAVHLQLVASRRRAVRRATRRSGGDGRPGSPRASRRRRRRARWRWPAGPPSGSPVRRPRPSTAAPCAWSTS